MGLGFRGSGFVTEPASEIAKRQAIEMIQRVAPAGACCAGDGFIALQREYIAMQYRQNKGLPPQGSWANRLGRLMLKHQSGLYSVRRPEHGRVPTLEREG
jgi:hypothetical protein